LAERGLRLDHIALARNFNQNRTLYICHRMPPCMKVTLSTATNRRAPTSYRKYGRGLKWRRSTSPLWLKVSCRARVIMIHPWASVYVLYKGTIIGNNRNIRIMSDGDIQRQTYVSIYTYVFIVYPELFDYGKRIKTVRIQTFFRNSTRI